MSPIPPGNTAEPLNTVLSGEEAAAHLARGSDLFKARKYNEAIAAFDAGIEHKRFADLAEVEQAGAHASLGEAWLRYGVRGVAKPALAAFEKATNHCGFEKLAPVRQAVTYLNLGRALRDTDRIDDAVEAFNKGIAHAGFKQLEPDRQAVAKGALETLQARVQSPTRRPVSGPHDRNR